MKKNILIIIIIILFYNSCVSQVINMEASISRRANNSHVIDTVMISQPIILHFKKGNRYNSFILSKETFNNLNNRKRLNLLKHPQIYLTSNFRKFSYLDPKKYINYLNTDSLFLGEKRVIVNKKIQYLPIETDKFILLNVNVDYFNSRESSLDFKKIKKACLKSASLKVVFELPPN